MKRSMILGAVLTALSSPAVWAHGDQHHAPAARTSSAGRTSQVEMTDQMRFTPSQISVKRGETARFVVKHAGANMAHVAPGSSGEIVWRFGKVVVE